MARVKSQSIFPKFSKGDQNALGLRQLWGAAGLYSGKLPFFLP